jgi:hypothetical protein
VRHRGRAMPVTASPSTPARHGAALPRGSRRPRSASARRRHHEPGACAARRASRAARRSASRRTFSWRCASRRSASLRCCSELARFVGGLLLFGLSRTRPRCARLLLLRLRLLALAAGPAFGWRLALALLLATAYRPWRRHDRGRGRDSRPHARCAPPRWPSALLAALARSASGARRARCAPARTATSPSRTAGLRAGPATRHRRGSRSAPALGQFLARLAHRRRLHRRDRGHAGRSGTLRCALVSACTSSLRGEVRW